MSSVWEIQSASVNALYFVRMRLCKSGRIWSVDMNNGRGKSNLGILKVIMLSLVFFFAAMLVLTQLVRIDTSQFIDISEKIHTVVVRPDGTRELYLPGDSYTIEKGDHFIMSILTDEDEYLPDGSLVFNMYNSIIKVYSGTELLYEQDTSDLKEGQMLGDLRYSIPLPHNYNHHEIKIEGDLISNSPFGKPASLMILPHDKTMQMALANNEFIFYSFNTLIVVSILFGFFFLILSIQDHRIHAGLWVSITSVIMCTWYLGYKTMLYIISDWTEFNAVVEYMAIFAINIPLSFFMHTQFSRPLYKRISLILGFLYLIFFVIATALNYSSSPIQYCDLLLYSHIFTGSGLLLYIIGLYTDDTTEKRFDFRVLRFGVSMSLVIGASAFVLFNLSIDAQNALKVAQFNYVPLAILILIISLYISVLTSYAQETITTMEAERLAKLAYMDSLTGAPNRSALYESFAMMEAKNLTDYVMVFMDINELKKTNDVYGHEMGDNLIILVSTAILQVFPQSETTGFVGRWGGDEFVACVFGSKETADEYISAFHKKLEKFNGEKLLPFPARVSVGTSISTSEAPKDPAKAITESDSAMYVDKAEIKKRLSETAAMQKLA